MKYLLSLALLSLVGFQPAPVYAQNGPSAADRATARRLATEGQVALKAGDFDTAADRFERANDLLAAPTFLVRLARARVGQGRLVEAHEIYRKIIREGVEADKPEAFKRALADAKLEVKAVEPRLAWISVNVVNANPNDVQVTLNDAVIPSAALGAQRPVDPGTLRVKAKAEGYKTAEAEVQLAEGEHLPAIEMRMTALPKPPPTPVVKNDPIMDENGGEKSSFMSQSTLGYVTLGVGGAGLVVGGITGLLAYSRHQDLVNTPCAEKVGNHCYVLDPTEDKQKQAQQTEKEMNTFATISTVSFIAGGALAATGLILLITAPEDPVTTAGTPTLHPYVGFGTIGAVGSF
jgi:tetratricopeptide (TPR) repeat protein